MAVTVTDETEAEDVETESEAEPAAEDVASDVVEEQQPRRPWLRRVLLGALIAALLGVSGFLGWQVWQQRQIAAASHDAQEAAVHYAQVLTSIDSNNVDQNFTEVLNGATGEFKDMYSQSSAQLRQLLVDNKATAHGVVIDSAVKSASENQVVVLLFVDQTVANKSAPDPRIDRSRVKMTMDKVDGAWRASKVELP
ncbi:tetratricopeptide repeat protein [Mycolicibacterium sphagni]|uniref:tetratricopeptide repeat protein n=1 Tax=Mycolicibacterium sphagni TaxID=1786 RepID=UPI0021F34359|nr:tetratricopeptide repeat protein [Mycolicibacterium sphagni]MCV7177409.1 tetratricopeptide repeat protein [Mycolicibacterium sphagni]